MAYPLDTWLVEGIPVELLVLLGTYPQHANKGVDHQLVPLGLGRNLVAYLLDIPAEGIPGEFLGNLAKAQGTQR